MKRVLHIVRSALPVPKEAIAPGDVVVYTPEAARAAPGPENAENARIENARIENALIWDPHDDAQITTAELYRLCFELDTVVVW